jgi:hypothetical protein
MIIFGLIDSLVVRFRIHLGSIPTSELLTYSSRSRFTVERQMNLIHIDSLWDIRAQIVRKLYHWGNGRLADCHR